MLKKEFRLSKRREIAMVKDKGRMYSSPTFGLLLLNDEGVSRFGWIISKKVSQKAVERNRSRRLLSMAVEKQWNKVGQKGWRALFLVRRNILGKTLAEVEKEVESVFRSIK